MANALSFTGRNFSGTEEEKERQMEGGMQGGCEGDLLLSEISDLASLFRSLWLPRRHRAASPQSLPQSVLRVSGELFLPVCVLSPGPGKAEVTEREREKIGRERR